MMLGSRRADDGRHHVVETILSGIAHSKTHLSEQGWSQRRYIYMFLEIHSFSYIYVFLRISSWQSQDQSRWDLFVRRCPSYWLVPAIGSVRFKFWNTISAFAFFCTSGYRVIIFEQWAMIF
jgi:hypothetical protein